MGLNRRYVVVEAMIIASGIPRESSVVGVATVGSSLFIFMILAVISFASSYLIVDLFLPLPFSSSFFLSLVVSSSFFASVVVLSHLLFFRFLGFAGTTPGVDCYEIGDWRMDL